MEGEKLDEALKHDAARKEQEQPRTAPEIGMDLMARQIEQKNAVLAKRVSAFCLETADAFRLRAVQSHPDEAAKLLDCAKKALDLARLADSLGDRSVVRSSSEK